MDMNSHHRIPTSTPEVSESVRSVDEMRTAEPTLEGGEVIADPMSWLLPFQADDVKKVLHIPGVLIANDMGLSRYW